MVKDLILVRNWLFIGYAEKHEYWSQFHAHQLFYSDFNWQLSNFCKIQICWKHAPIILCRSSRLQQMFHIPTIVNTTANKGHLILEWHFGVFKSSKKPTKI